MDRRWVKSITWQVQDEPNIFVMPVILLDLCNEKRSPAKVRGCDYHEIEQQISCLASICHSCDSMVIVKQMKVIVPEFVSKNSVYEILDKKQ